MPDFYNRMGYQNRLYIGTAGAAPGTRLDNVTDLNYDIALAYGPTTRRGDSTSLPVEYEKPVSRKPTITWTMNDEPNDANLATLRAAAKAGTPVSLKITELDDTAGAGETTVVSGDFNVKIAHNYPLAGTGTFPFEASPSRDYNTDVSFS